MANPLLNPKGQDFILHIFIGTQWFYSVKLTLWNTITFQGFLYRGTSTWKSVLSTLYHVCTAECNRTPPHLTCREQVCYNFNLTALAQGASSSWPLARVQPQGLSWDDGSSMGSLRKVQGVAHMTSILQVQGKWNELLLPSQSFFWSAGSLFVRTHCGHPHLQHTTKNRGQCRQHWIPIKDKRIQFLEPSVTQVSPTPTRLTLMSAGCREGKQAPVVSSLILVHPSLAQLCRYHWAMSAKLPRAFQ